MQNNYLARRYSFAEYWIPFMAHFDGVHAFGYNSAGSEPIWMKFGTLRVHCLPLALAVFGFDLRSPLSFFYRWNQLKVIPLDSRLRTGNDVHPNRCLIGVVLQTRCHTTNLFAWRRHLTLTSRYC